MSRSLHQRQTGAPGVPTTSSPSKKRPRGANSAPAQPKQTTLPRRFTSRSVGSYTDCVAPELFEDMKRYVGFGEADARALRLLSAPLSPMLPAIVEEFYQAILRHPNARAVFGSNLGQLDRLKKTLRQWIAELFSGNYEESYFEARCRIGRTHVLVDLPQHFMFTGMTIIRLGLMDAMAKLPAPPPVDSVRALHKILDLELAIMNQTYREDLVKRMQQIERAEYEARISESEHLATIGQLAASLAHEIKNPLAGISGAIQVLGSSLDASHPNKPIIAEALRQIDRLDAAVKDLLIYARPKPPERAPHDLADIIRHALIILREEPSFRGVKVHCDGLSKGHLLKVDATQLQQVVTNLLLNAAHACEKGGEVHCHVSRTTGGMRLVIEDTGGGIPPHVLARVFEPFFTTKAKGTGLGLSICKRVVESHGGTLKIESKVGDGTRVTVELPEVA